MSWIVSLVVLALLAWFGIRMLKRNAVSGADETRDPLEHDRDGVNPPLPGQRAATDGEVHDAARSHVGEHLEPDPVAGGRPDDDRVARPDGSLDADAAARAAEASRDTGGTGAAVLAGVATAAGATAAGERAERAGTSGHDAHGSGSDGHEADGRGTDEHGGDDAAGTDPSDRVNAPDPETAGTLDVEKTRAASAAGTSDVEESSAGAARSGASADDAPAHDASSGERVPARDDARTNAPIGDTSTAAAAREPVEPAPGDDPDGHAPTPAENVEPEDRANAPDPGTAGAGALSDRSIGARSNLVAGTVSLASGGATAASGEAVREDGGTTGEHAARLADGAALPSDGDRLANGDGRANVREMMKILNLRESDASRLDISTDDFARLRGDDGSVDPSLVDQVGTRLRRMLG